MSPSLFNYCRTQVRRSPILRVLSLLLALFIANGFGENQLRHYGLIHLENSEINQRLAQRFNANGQALFLVHDLQIGIKEGDIIRFKDKAVLIDADVWETLRAEGALSHLSQAPIIQIQAKASSGSWIARSKRLRAEHSQKAHKLGAEFLKIIEEHFGRVPAHQEMVLQFKGKDLVLLAPHELLDQLPFAAVRRIKESGGPQIISEPPPDFLYIEQEFLWQAWAVDTDEPASNISYSYSGDLPEGLIWDGETHSIKGTPTQSGNWSVWVHAKNTRNQTDSLLIQLHFNSNERPVISNRPPLVAKVGYPWSFIPVPSDPDHNRRELKIIPQEYPAEMTWDSLTGSLNWTPLEEYLGDTVYLELKVQDPLGAYSQYHYQITVPPPNKAPEFVSHMGFWKIEEGQKVQYKPVAIDPEGGPVRLKMVLPRDNSITWSNETLHLSTQKPGLHSAQLFATDTLDKTSRQIIGYYVYPQKKVWTGAAMRSNFVGDIQAWELLFERGAARMGLYTTNPGLLIENESLLYRYWPIVFVGVNLLGHRQMLQGQHLFIDIGLSLRQATKTITVGGLMLRGHSRFRSPGPLQGFVEIGAEASAQQGILIANANSIDVDEFINRADSGLYDLYGDYNDSKNILAYIQLEAWYPAEWGFWTGPVTWRTDNPLFKKHHQRIGWGLRNEFNTLWFRGQTSFRLGFGGSSAGVGWHWDTKISFGKWD